MSIVITHEELKHSSQFKHWSGLVNLARRLREALLKVAAAELEIVARGSNVLILEQKIEISSYCWWQILA